MTLHTKTVFVPPFSKRPKPEVTGLTAPSLFETSNSSEELRLSSVPFRPAQVTVKLAAPVAVDSNKGTSTDATLRPKVGFRHVYVVVRRSFERAMAMRAACNTMQHVPVWAAPSVVSSDVKLAYTLHKSHSTQVGRPSEPTTFLDVTSVCTTVSRGFFVLFPRSMDHSQGVRLCA